MKKIKFRGKRLDNGQWVYGDLLHIAGGSLIYTGSPRETKKPDIEVNSNVAVELMLNEVAVITPDTIEQFTGLCDKTGKEIYEGDTLSLCFNRHIYTATVGWNNQLGAWCIGFDDQEKVGLRPLGHWLADSAIKVIGNMYDNSDLMKGGGK